MLTKVLIVLYLRICLKYQKGSLVDIPYCIKMKNCQSVLLKRLKVSLMVYLTYTQCGLRKNQVIVSTQKKNPTLIMCEGMCTCKESCIGKTRRNVKIRRKGHQDA